jgi:hypothetical protein
MVWFLVLVLGLVYLRWSFYRDYHDAIIAHRLNPCEL